MIFMALAFAIFGIVFAGFGMHLDNILVTGFGILFVLGAVFLVYQIAKEKRLRKLYEENPEEYEAMIEEEEKEWEEKNPEAVEYEKEMEEIRDFDNDSGKGYCPFCGNYSVNSEKTCESCGEKVDE
ncbi:MAG: hypothetical protein IJZ07_08355 [Clostridia bacterium]|nr:hypothetical protein [Clostridia bacterium]